MRRKPAMAAIAGVLFVLLVAAFSGGQAQGAGLHPATGVGSCTLKNWNPGQDADDAKDLPEGSRPQTYKPDDYNCTGAKFATNGVEFAKFPQPHNFSAPQEKSAQPAQPSPAEDQHGQHDQHGHQPARPVLPAVHPLRDPLPGEPHLRRLPR